MLRSVYTDTGSVKAASCAAGIMPSSRRMAAMLAASTGLSVMLWAAFATPEA